MSRLPIPISPSTRSSSPRNPSPESVLPLNVFHVLEEEYVALHGELPHIPGKGWDVVPEEEDPRTRNLRFGYVPLRLVVASNRATIAPDAWSMYQR